MDKEQAIDLLDNLIGMIEDNQDNDYDTAFRMAIDALKAQHSQEGTTSDTISRQAAIDLCDWYDNPSMREDLEKLPPAQPEPKEGHWIWVAGDLMCSECHTIFTDLYPDYDNSVACPHCGAYMKGCVKHENHSTGAQNNR